MATDFQATYLLLFYLSSLNLFEFSGQIMIFNLHYGNVGSGSRNISNKDFSEQLTMARNIVYFDSVFSDIWDRASYVIADLHFLGLRDSPLAVAARLGVS